MGEDIVLVIPTDGNDLDQLVDTIASWAKYGPAFDRVIIAGNVKDLHQTFGKIITVHVDQHQRRPRANQQKILDLMLKTVPQEAHIVWAHDDTFLIDKTSVDELRYLTRCANAHTEKRHKAHGDAAATQNTLRRLQYKQLPTHNYELHLPLFIEVAQRREYLQLLRECDNETQFRTWVLNHIWVHGPAKMIDDVKIFRQYERPDVHGDVKNFISLAKNLDHKAYFDQHFPS